LVGFIVFIEGFAIFEVPQVAIRRLFAHFAVDFAKFNCRVLVGNPGGPYLARSKVDELNNRWNREPIADGKAEVRQV
jgi:hypothetical protein